MASCAGVAKALLASEDGGWLMVSNLGGGSWAMGAKFCCDTKLLDDALDCKKGCDGVVDEPCGEPRIVNDAPGV